MLELNNGSSLSDQGAFFVSKIHRSLEKNRPPYFDSEACLHKIWIVDMLATIKSRPGAFLCEFSRVSYEDW